jgi:hypothetical protein
MADVHRNRPPWFAPRGHGGSDERSVTADFGLRTGQGVGPEPPAHSQIFINSPADQDNLSRWIPGRDFIAAVAHRHADPALTACR